MGLNQLGKDRPWLVIWGLVCFVLVVFAGSFTFYVRHESDQARDDRDRRAQEAKVAIEERATQSIATCKAAVVAVTEQGKIDDLKILKTIADRFAETGRPVPPIYLALQAEVSNRQPPVAACIPKESP